jgi:hypothetical protein
LLLAQLRIVVSAAVQAVLAAAPNCSRRMRSSRRGALRLGQACRWDFHGGRIFAALGNFDDDSNPLSGYGWLCRLVDASVLQAGGFYRVRKPLLPL